MKKAASCMPGANTLKLVFCYLLPLACCAVLSCNSPFTPKPRGYFKIEFPEKKYQQFSQAGYPYSFEYPVYANVVKDSLFFGEATENPWWINVEFPDFNGKIYMSYKQVGVNKFDKLVNDAFTLTNKHSQKAFSIDDSVIVTSNNVYGMFFKVGGDVATAYQFYLTDSVNHFIRGALYFEATPNKDSIGIVNDFVAQDMRHLINTFRWNSSPASSVVKANTSVANTHIPSAKK